MNPPLQRGIPFELIPVLCFQDVLVVELGEGYARVGVEVGGVLGKVVDGGVGFGHCWGIMGEVGGVE